MGISRRNPRGNFNWQSRMLKRRAICCGGLDERFDCGALAPILAFGGFIICKDKLAPANANITITNTQPNQAADTFYELYKGGPGGALAYSGYGPVYTITLTPVQQIVGETKFWVVATNQFGCITEQLLTIYVFNKPALGAIVGIPTNPCVPSAHPSGFSSNGTINALNTNVSSNALYYVYKITYGPSSPNPGYVGTFTTTASNYIWTGLCDGVYTLDLELWGSIDGVPTLVCTSPSFISRFGPFILSFDNIANVPVTNPADKAEWTALSFFSGSLSSVSVIGNDVYFYPTSQGAIQEPPTNPAWDNHIVGVDDRAGWIILVGNNAFDSAPALSSVKLRNVQNIQQYAFYNTGGFLADFPLCTSIGQYSFAQSKITGALFPLLVTVPDFAFTLTTSMSSIYFPIVKNIGYESFSYCVFSVADFPKVFFVDQRAFLKCLNLTDIDMPEVITVQDSAFGISQNLVNIYMPLVQTVGFDCFAGNIGFPALYNNVLTSVSMPSLLTAGPGAFQYILNLKQVDLPAAANIGNLCFRNTDLTDINIPSCVLLGNTSGDNFVFSAISGNTISATVNSVLQTNNAGGLDGDLAALNAANTVTFTWV